MEDAEKENLLKEALQKPASTFMMRVDNFEKQHDADALQKYYSYVKLFEDYVELLSTSIEGIKYVPKEGYNFDSAKLAQSVLISKIPKTLISAFNLMMTGYYDEGLAICRMAYECILAICFIEKNPKYYFSVFAYKMEKEIKKHQINLPSMKAFKPSVVLKEELKVVVAEDKIYSFLSKPIHSNKLTISEDFFNAHKEGAYFLNLGFDFDEKDLQIGLNYSLALLYLSLSLFEFMFQAVLDSHKEKFHFEFEPLRIYLSEYPENSAFSNFVGLVDNIVSALKNSKGD